ncbi:hypothetical protein [Rhodopirellula sallentina]|uniref:hypothetical protein n=1 Tax=Rhodopirellula sallentina TaxID=1263869 RepID=UPI0011817BB1|nr:hypothetical protein [Rhodopirellula sallentina]
MVRHTLSIAAILTVFVLCINDSANVQAQGFSRSGYGYGYGVPMYPTRFGAGSPMGYVYDPYASGSFEPPDMHNDPMFRAQHKFDSHFPGRYRRNQPLELRGSVTHQHRYSAPRQYRSTTPHYHGW